MKKERRELQISDFDSFTPAFAYKLNHQKRDLISILQSSAAGITQSPSIYFNQYTT